VTIPPLVERPRELEAIEGLLAARHRATSVVRSRLRGVAKSLVLTSPRGVE